MSMPRKQELYRSQIVGDLIKQFEYNNVMKVPRLSKIVLNVSMKEAIQDVKVLEAARDELNLVTGQAAIIRRARRSVANFKLREGMPIGTMVTLRRKHMWEFLDRLVSVTIPRVRDFRGLNANGFDGRGNFSMGITEQIVFPEIDYDKVSRIHGMNISFVTTAKTDDEGRALLKALGVPFAERRVA